MRVLHKLCRLSPIYSLSLRQSMIYWRFRRKELLSSLNWSSIVFQFHSKHVCLMLCARSRWQRMQSTFFTFLFEKLIASACTQHSCFCLCVTFLLRCCRMINFLDPFNDGLHLISTGLLLSSTHSLIDSLSSF